MRRSVLLAVMAFVVVIGLLVVDRAMSPAGDHVAVVGDSISAIGGRQLSNSVGTEYHVDIQARFGARVGDQLPYAKLVAATKPQQVIIDLGTNDALHGTPLAEYSSQLSQMIGLFKPAQCIHLVTINTHLDQDGNEPKAPAEAINQVIEHWADRDDRIDLIRWDEIMDDSVSAQHPFGLTEDGVHPTPEGQRQLAQAELRAMDRCGRPWHVW